MVNVLPDPEKQPTSFNVQLTHGNTNGGERRNKYSNYRGFQLASKRLKRKRLSFELSGVRYARIRIIGSSSYRK